MVFDAPNPKKSPSIILSFQNYRPECIAMCSNFTLLFGQCHSTLSFCYENMSPNTSIYDGKYSPVRNFPVFCKKKNPLHFGCLFNILLTLVFSENVISPSSKLFFILK